MTWICKKCGQIQPDSIIYGDGICDDCFEKINKKKKKGSAFNKILSLALLLSFMLCIFSGFGVASAEELNTGSADEISVMGTYMDYELIKYEPGTEIFNKTLISYFDSKWNYNDNPNQYLSYCLLDFDSSGNPYIYTLASNGFGLSVRFAGSNIHCFSFTGLTFNCELTNYPSYFRSIYMSWQDNFNFYTFESSSPDKKSEYTRTIYCNGGEFTGYQDSDKYLLLIPHSDANQATPIFNDLLTGSKDDFNLIESSTLPKANFYTCKSAPFTDTSQSLWVKSWLKDGEQYPYFGWWINDNGNNHKYKVVFSYNDTQKELFETFYNSTKSNPLFSDGWWVEKAFPILSVSKESMIIANEMATQTGFADFMANKTWWMWHYNTLFTLNHSSMDFTSQTGNKIYSINLSDYSSVYQYLFYRAQIVDVTTGDILDTVYFTSQESYNKSDSGYGSKVYDYGDNSQGMIDDLKNNTPSVDPDNLGDFISDGDVIDTPIIDENGNTIWDNINIGGMYSPLNFGLSAVSDFFQNLWVIFPVEIRTIIISGMSLIVVLRILGR